jgi:rhodanese-related sulfurtransferase
MKYNIFILALASIFWLACSGGGSEKNADNLSEKTADSAGKPLIVPAEIQLLLDYLDETDDYVNSREFPSLIKASIVYEELNQKNHLIDIRKAEEFKKGHIKGAINVDFKNIPEYFQLKIKPFEYDKIIIICSTGQYASYTTSLLRLMGYGNVYAMRWGMSAWDMDAAKINWLAGVSSKFENSLETTDIPKPLPVGFASLNSKSTEGESLLLERVRQVFDAGLENTIVQADSLFNNPGKYFVINLERKDKYDAGHIPGAVRYKPNETLGIVEEMATIPSDKEVVIYCGTGHNSAFAAAYLTLFGYKARSLNYGNGSFMHNKMAKEKETLSWVLFGEGDVMKYPLNKGLK